MTDYAALAADNDPRELKKSVSLARVALHYGIDLESDGNGGYSALCPFHADTSPSFRIWRYEDSDFDFCGCWACDFGNSNDLFDFLQRKEGCDFRSAMALALDLRDGDLPAAPEVTARPDEPTPDFGRMLERATGLDVVTDLLNERGIHVPAEWLRDEFRVQSDNYGVIVPHFNEAGDLRGLKTRTPVKGWTPIATKGSRLDSLYGIWRTKRRQELVICEGESDTWATAYMLRDHPVSVVGLPSGVSTGPRQEWIDWASKMPDHSDGKPRRRTVTILFDADRAGREGAAKWAAVLRNEAETVRIAALPDGTDVNTAGESVTMQALAEAWPFVHTADLPIIRTSGVYMRPSRDPDKPATVLSDFVLTPERLIVMHDGGIVFEVMVPGNQDRQILTGAELASTDRMRRWATDRLLSWKGSARDLADLLELLKAESILIPRVKGTDVVGLHGNAFVLPDDVIGASGWGYVPPENDVNLGESIRLGAAGSWARELPWLLVHMHAPEVITPILGWVASAPLRSLVKKYPVLAVTGGSGWGKTTILATILDAFGFWTTSPTTLTGATAHGVHSYAGSTNAFPIWIDEYRPGARVEAKMALDQVIRDAWDGSATIKGGMSENRMKIKKLPARAPLVVTGEDSFSETSHAERMVMIDMPKDGKNVEVLVAIQRCEKAGFGRAYLEWLLLANANDILPEIPALPDRPLQARAVAAWGYEILDQFCREVLGYELPPYAGDLTKQAHDDVERVPVILEAIIKAYNITDHDGHLIAWREGDDLCVKTMSLSRWAKENGVQLPGGYRAVGTWLKAQYGAQEYMHPVYNRAWRLTGKASLLDTE